MTTITDLPEDCLQLLEECMGLSDVVNLSEICRALAARIRNAAWPHRQVQVLHLVEIHSGTDLNWGSRIRLSQINHAMRARRQHKQWQMRYTTAWMEFLAEDDYQRCKAWVDYMREHVHRQGVWWMEPWWSVSGQPPMKLLWGPAPAFDLISVPRCYFDATSYKRAMMHMNGENFGASSLSSAMACLNCGL